MPEPPGVAQTIMHVTYDGGPDYAQADWDAEGDHGPHDCCFCELPGDVDWIGEPWYRYGFVVLCCECGEQHVEPIHRGPNREEAWAPLLWEAD